MFSFSNYNNAEAAVIKLLKRLSINADPAKVIAELGKHPDYPSLLAISDVLSNFDIDNNALIIYLNIFFMKNVNKLSRAEMKNVKGGVGMATCAFYGTCQGYVGAPTGSYDPDHTAMANQMQTDADTWCSTRSCCTNVDCPGAA